MCTCSAEADAEVDKYAYLPMLPPDGIHVLQKVKFPDLHLQDICFSCTDTCVRVKERRGGNRETGVSVPNDNFSMRKHVSVAVINVDYQTFLFSYPKYPAGI